MTANTAVLARRVGQLAPLDNFSLAQEPLQALGDDRARVDAAGGTSVARGRVREAGRADQLRAVAKFAVIRSRVAQVRRQRDGLFGVQQALVGAAIAVAAGIRRR